METNTTVIPAENNDVSAYWATPEPLRQSFERGKHAGRALTAGTALGIIGATIGFLTLPVWGVSLLGGIAASITIANVLGYAMDRDNHCQLEVGKTVLNKPAMTTGKDFFRQGLKNGFRQTLKKLPLAIIGTPFWPALLVAAPLINKGTRGYYFFPTKDKAATATIPAPEAAGGSSLATQPPLHLPFTAAATANPPAPANDTRAPKPPAASAPRNAAF
ncbi:MAG: hypothetical protein PW788_09070 [Micavibrio sp.]|nr:hypothetical protein [Micavibrio sp.]